MAVQMLSDLLADLSAEQQQFLAGGQATSDDELLEGSEDKDDRGDVGSALMSLRSGVYRITKTSKDRSIVRIQKLRGSED